MAITPSPITTFRIPFRRVSFSHQGAKLIFPVPETVSTPSSSFQVTASPQEPSSAQAAPHRHSTSSRSSRAAPVFPFFRYFMHTSPKQIMQVYTCMIS